MKRLGSDDLEWPERPWLVTIICTTTTTAAAAALYLRYCIIQSPSGQYTPLAASLRLVSEQTLYLYTWTPSPHQYWVHLMWPRRPAHEVPSYISTQGWLKEILNRPNSSSPFCGAKAKRGTNESSSKRVFLYKSLNTASLKFSFDVV